MKKTISQPTPENQSTFPPILYEDEALMAINKPANLIIQDSHTHNETTLETLLPNAPELERSGVVHRLDRDTSGVMLLAKTSVAQQDLQQQFKDRQIHKQYQALVWGKFKDEHAIVDAPIDRHPVHGHKFVVMEGGKEAKTEIWRNQIYDYQGEPVSLLTVAPHSGRTHQIRVHLTALGYPIIGDKIYGRRKDKAPIRQFLHARSIEFVHPVTKESMTIEAPLAEDLAEFLSKLQLAE